MFELKDIANKDFLGHNSAIFLFREEENYTSQFLITDKSNS